MESAFWIQASPVVACFLFLIASLSLWCPTTIFPGRAVLARIWHPADAHQGKKFLQANKAFSDWVSSYSTVDALASRQATFLASCYWFQENNLSLTFKGLRYQFQLLSAGLLHTETKQFRFLGQPLPQLSWESVYWLKSPSIHSDSLITQCKIHSIQLLTFWFNFFFAHFTETFSNLVPSTLLARYSFWQASGLVGNITLVKIVLNCLSFPF